MTVLEEMGAVLRAVPGLHASAEDVAHWYERKAALLEHIAAAGGPDAGWMRSQADRAHRHAADLLAPAR